MITSSSNSKVQLVRILAQQKKVRYREMSFVAEGIRLIEEAEKHQIRPQFLFHVPSLSERGKALIDAFKAKDVPVFDVSPEVMDFISDTEATQGIIGVFSMESYEFPSNPSFLLLVDGVRDPGNLGTLLRSAWAAGVDAILTTEGTVDLFSPKVVRAGMGTHFSLPLLASNWDTVLQKFPVNNPLNYYATVVYDGMNVWDCDLTGPSVIIVGGEADGVSALALTIAQKKVTIPMAANTESLNAGVAGSLVLFEVLRQRTSH